MAIPDYQTLMLPLLQIAGDGKEHNNSEVLDQLAKKFELTDDELEQLLPSGGQPLFYNRVHWAKTYLSQAGLIRSTRRAHFQITERGEQTLRERPDKINVDYLTRFGEFKAFKDRARQSQKNATSGSTDIESQTATPAPILDTQDTPDEVLRATVKSLDKALSKELLDRILAEPPAFFEGLIVKLLLEMGYGGSREDAGRAIGKSGDGGIDGVIDQDRLGLDRVYIQAKRYKIDGPVSEPEIRAFSGSLGAAKADKGIFVTTSYFTKPAIDFAQKHPFKMVLIDGDQLTALMIRHNVGVRVAETLYLKKIDEDFFSEE
jgi:restriction system protein